MFADRFKGSGYKAGANLIATSAHYNDPLMKGVEDKIEEQILDSDIDTFEGQAAGDPRPFKNVLGIDTWLGNASA